MRHLAPLALVVIAAIGCATASPPPPTLPPATDLDSLLPPAPPLPALPSDLPDGPTTSIDVGQCRDLPAGFWVSERSYAVLVGKAAELEQRRVEATALRNLRVVERGAAMELERAYRDRLTDAERSARWRLWVGIAVGAGVVLAGAWAAGQVAR